MATMKDAEFLKKVISEAEVSARKCAYYAGLASAEDVRNAFAAEEKKLRSSAKSFEVMYESLLKG